MVGYMIVPTSFSRPDFAGSVGSVKSTYMTGLLVFICSSVPSCPCTVGASKPVEASEEGKKGSKEKERKGNTKKDEERQRKEGKGRARVSYTLGTGTGWQNGHFIAYREMKTGIGLYAVGRSSRCRCHCIARLCWMA